MIQLLKILAGMDGLDAGAIATMKDARIGYLPQKLNKITRHFYRPKQLRTHEKIRAIDSRCQQWRQQCAYGQAGLATGGTGVE